MTPPNLLCHVCGDGALELFPVFPSLLRACSDGRPWKAGGALGFCTLCRTVQKPVDDAWRAESREIYSRYDPYHQSIGGAEQAVFDQKTGAATPRSARILSAVHTLARLQGKGRMLDIGCGNGPMLRAASDVAPEWELNGLDPHVKSRDALLQIRGVKEIFEGSVDDVPGTFDLISVIHTLEHIENPVSFLKRIGAKLAPKGQLLIEVPYFVDNPFDLLLADHCSHFTQATLLAALVAAEFSPVVMRTDVVAKEITVLAERASSGQRISLVEVPASDIDKTRTAVQTALGWFQALLSEAKAISSSDNFGLFGTSISANWLLGALSDRVRFFVDEDPSRIGTTYFGCPVLHPRKAPRGSDVFMVLPRFLAEQIIARLRPEGARFHLSPEYKAVITEVPYAARN